jgi:hypothetical protein
LRWDGSASEAVVTVETPGNRDSQSEYVVNAKPGGGMATAYQLHEKQQLVFPASPWPTSDRSNMLRDWDSSSDDTSESGESSSDSESDEAFPWQTGKRDRLWPVRIREPKIEPTALLPRSGDADFLDVTVFSYLAAMHRAEMVDDASTMEWI